MSKLDLKVFEYLDKHFEVALYGRNRDYIKILDRRVSDGFMFEPTVEIMEYIQSVFGFKCYNKRCEYIRFWVQQFIDNKTRSICPKDYMLFRSKVSPIIAFLTKQCYIDTVKKKTCVKILPSSVLFRHGKTSDEMIMCGLKRFSDKEGIGYITWANSLLRFYIKPKLILTLTHRTL